MNDLIKAADALCETSVAIYRETGHKTTCNFSGCTCGAVENFKVACDYYIRALNNYRKLRENKSER